MPLSCAYVHLCSTQGCATYLPGKCSLSGRVSTTKFTKTQGGRGSQACANAFSSALVSAQANRADCSAGCSTSGKPVPNPSSPA